MVSFICFWWLSSAVITLSDTKIIVHTDHEKTWNFTNFIFEDLKVLFLSGLWKSHRKTIIDIIYFSIGKWKENRWVNSIMYRRLDFPWESIDLWVNNFYFQKKNLSFIVFYLELATVLEKISVKIWWSKIWSQKTFKGCEKKVFEFQMVKRLPQNPDIEVQYRYILMTGALLFFREKPILRPAEL